MQTDNWDIKYMHFFGFWTEEYVSSYLISSKLDISIILGQRVLRSGPLPV